MDHVYLDYAASAPLRPEAVRARAAYEQLPCACANPNSLHSLGREASRHLEAARSTMARCLGGGLRPGDICFCGGGTEADNLALLGISQAMAELHGKPTVIISAIEHDAVLDLAPLVRARGGQVRVVGPDREGRITPGALEEVMDETVGLVSVMAANNETGVVQPTSQLASVAHGAGARFMVDGIQAFGRIPQDLSAVDAYTLAGHKIGAPVGTAVLALRRGTPFKPVLVGGGQEMGRRPGTQDVAGARALAAVAEAVTADLGRVRPQVASRARAMMGRILAGSDHVHPTLEDWAGPGQLPGLVSLLVDDLESEGLVLALDAAGYEVSAGSACSTGSLEPSHVLRAMGIPRDVAFGSLRVSFDERVGEEVLLAFADTLCRVVAELRGREGL